MKQTIILFLALLTCSPLLAAEQSITRSPLWITSGELQLSGTVMALESGEKRPGVVLLHGSGPGPKSELMDVAEGLARANLVVLVFDKRGSGESEGSWVSSSLFDLAADGVAAFQALAAQPNVDPDKVGLWGVSQGGWIVPLVMNQTDASFGIVITGGGASPRQVETTTYEQSVARTNPTPREVENAEHLVDTYMGYLAGTVGKPDLDALFAKHDDQQWFQALGIERVVPSESNRHNWEWVARFDPTESISATNSPVLVLLGSDDPLVPLEASATAWRKSLPEDVCGNKVQVIQGAGHGLRVQPHGGPRVSDYFELQIDWLRKISIY